MFRKSSRGTNSCYNTCNPCTFPVPGPHGPSQLLNFYHAGTGPTASSVILIDTQTTLATYTIPVSGRYQIIASCTTQFISNTPVEFELTISSSVTPPINSVPNETTRIFKYQPSIIFEELFSISTNGQYIFPAGDIITLTIISNANNFILQSYTFDVIQLN